MLRYDFRGFAKSLKMDLKGAVNEALIRHVYSHLFKILYNYDSYSNWLSLFYSLISRRRFLLIVLDDARYDAFKAVYGRYLGGDLMIVRVPPPNTYGWLPKAFSHPDFNNVRVFYAGIGIESHDIRIGSFVPRGRRIEVIPIRPSKARHLLTVLPSEVNDAVMRIGLSGRDIVWYAQPHFPWVLDEELSLMLMKDALIHDYVPPDTIGYRLRMLGVGRDRVIRAYYANLVLVLKYVKDLLNYVKRQNIDYDEVVVTSDHGEMLGEFGLYLHQEYDLPQLVLVPWLRVSL
ncbi:hypothetical protein [Vulcanisaeta distributa]|uniref:Sulfatase N-terminal domain-containing protein n=1 Tax=Vulcanisaeta distributa (strain DSM 14429 / JCM 11212 / NBRC 100878 / IC-017) TaxID=572478 RepID=E1QUC6_VULDI|nr:hypothetical protein [Vulcanisaeta distributa]ADN49852.1 hypothetical protein Vdis_0452 [Vulcanisaeta distributa DSM 14429]